MAYVTSPDVALGMSPKHDHTSPSYDGALYMYQTFVMNRTAITCAHMSRIWDIACIEFDEELDKANIKY